ncbi:MAG: hypothetical protein H0X25_22605, partial [Acidobacteriales bacterium]|nr:hypothetical protein [Terriglobales bacterium]
MRKRFGWLLLAAMTCVGMGAAAEGQGVRYNDQLMTTSGTVPYGAMAPLLSVPNAAVSVCAVNSNPCSAVGVYSDVALSMPMAQPLKTDAAGRFGFYVTAGNYYYKAITLTGQNMGPFPFSVIGGGGSGVPSVNGITGAVTINNAAGVSVTTVGATITIGLPTTFAITSFT